MPYAHVICHCGQDHVDFASDGACGWIGCQCGCEWKYVNVNGTMDITKTKNCDGSDTTEGRRPSVRDRIWNASNRDEGFGSGEGFGS